MAINKRRHDVLLLIWLTILLSTTTSYATYADLNDFLCLQKVRNSIEDPNNYLSNWDFNSSSNQGDDLDQYHSFCGFSGVECSQGRVSNIRLQNMGLRGPFPLGLVNCTFLTGLSLLGNSLQGSLPENISEIIPYVTELDLSNNNFSGPIPELIANITYLNGLNLAHNRFNGSIPLELGNLARIKTFSVADNNLTGQIPNFTDNANITKAAYENNSGLCGKPIFDPCPVPSKKSNMRFIAAGTAGGITIVVVLTGVAFVLISRMKVDGKKKGNLNRNTRAKSSILYTNTAIIKHGQVFKFEKSGPKMAWRDLMKATDELSDNNIISSEITGIMYKATLRDGTRLMLKRLTNLHQTEKDFLEEMKILGNLKHPNLVPLLGFCITKNERFLVYKYMANGNLYDQLHPTSPEPSVLIWPLRLKIAVGAAKGLAWLEQNHIHGKVNSKCIYLDEDYEPKLCEFGLATLNNPSDTHFSTFGRGEFGHVSLIAPEYSNKHNFGTVLLELVTGQKPFQVANASESFHGSLVEWVYKLSTTSTQPNFLHSVVDKSLLAVGVDEDELLQFLGVARSCVSPEPNKRPIMSQVYRRLNAIGETRRCNNVGDTTRDAEFAADLIVTCE